MNPAFSHLRLPPLQLVLLAPASSRGTLYMSLAVLSFEKAGLYPKKTFLVRLLHMLSNIISGITAHPIFGLAFWGSA